MSAKISAEGVGDEGRPGGDGLGHGAVLFRRKVRVEGEGDGPDGGDGHVGDAPSGRIFREDRDDVPFVASLVPEEQGEGLGSAQGFAEGDSLFSKEDPVCMAAADRSVGHGEIPEFHEDTRLSY